MIRNEVSPSHSLYDLLLDAITEDYSEEELQSSARIRSEIQSLYGVSRSEYEYLIQAASEIRSVRTNVEPDWKPLLTVH